MSLCINPQCTHPQNPDHHLFCQNCGSELLLAGRYRVQHLLSDKGGFSLTYEVTDNQSPKVLKLLTHPNPKAVELFHQEGRVLQQITHPGIPQGEGAFTFFPKDSTTPIHCLVMEKIAGVDLEEYMRQRDRQPIDAKQALEWLTQLASILQAIHSQQFFHRDIKPSNIILKSNGQLVLIDFGAARQVTATILEGGQSTGIYTPGYAPLEQERGFAVPQSDFYALGRTFVYLLTGRELNDIALYNPHSNRLEWRKLAPHVPSSLADFIDQLMARSPQQRPASPQAILQRLSELQRDLYAAVPPPAVPPTIITTPAPPHPPHTEPSRSPGAPPIAPPPVVPAPPSTPDRVIPPANSRQPSRRWFIGAATAAGVVLGGVIVRSSFSNRKSNLTPSPAPVPSPSASPVPTPSPLPSPVAELVVSPSGQGNYQTIGEAIRNAQSGTRIRIQPGTYSEAVVLDKTIELVGDGVRETIILQSADANCITMQTDRAVVSGLTIRCQAGEQEFYAIDIPQGELLLTDCDITSNSLACIGIHGATTNPVIQNCQIHTGNQVGILFYDNAKGTIKDCDIYRHALAGIEMREGSTPTVQGCKIRDGQASGLFIHSNAQGIIEGCEIFGNTFAGLEVNDGGNPTVRNCTFYNGKEGGILVQGQGKGTLTNCDVYGNTLVGVEIRQGGNPSLQGCQIHDGKESGILVHDAGQGTITECNIYGNALAGVRVETNGAPTLRNCNIYQGQQGGFLFTEGGLGTIEQCDIYSNALAGIEIRVAGSNPTIRQCTLRDGTEGGVLVHTNGQGTVENCDILNHGLSGVEVREAGNPIIRDCRISNNQGYGVYAHLNGAGVVTGNDLRGNLSGALSIEDGSTTETRENIT